ncbi:hypothetical protein GUJ93_ZPchr0016g2631 [Zizania palustris]|uniref:PHD-type domain-containing protein n=1 Tax=Zizania palustris TaxID=103762 RepID=A0A8J5TM42_ZIZPA|nr:hypothetical protein GUJ93_ZPchr0016g2631 [Zizania palustris]
MRTTFCKCEMPYNPDDLMIQCEECSDWFHPSCIGMTIKNAKKLEHFFCQSCTAENGKMDENFHEATVQSEDKPILYSFRTLTRMPCWLPDPASYT